jgi:hypothetical protein
MSEHVEFVPVEFEPEERYFSESEIPEPSAPMIDINDPRLTSEVLTMNPEANAYGPNFVVLRVRTDARRGLLTIAEQG